MRELFTLGVEEEYLLVDPTTGELRSEGAVVLETDRSGEVTGEAQETLVEIGTPVVHGGAELMERLRERRFQAGAAAAAVDLELLALGTHPVSGWKGHELTQSERSAMLYERFRHIVRLDHICGMHVHVAVPEGVDRILLMNRVRAWTPHLLALAASSPFHAGEDTGFASIRTMMWRRYPLSGAPPYFASADEHRQFMDTLLRSGMIPDERTVYWSVRPSPRYPTLELRVCDVCPSIGDAVAIAVLARALVVAAAEGKLPDPSDALPDPLHDVVLRENEWTAARDGLDAELVAPDRPGARMSVRASVYELLDIVSPIAESLGDTKALGGIATILTRGNAAQRLRDVFEKQRDMLPVTRWAVEETRAGSGMDRRGSRRDDVTDGFSLAHVAR